MVTNSLYAIILNRKTKRGFLATNLLINGAVDKKRLKEVLVSEACKAEDSAVDGKSC
ncbi:hypothetical protein AAK938_07365 [Aerococcaceae bacterium 50-4]